MSLMVPKPKRETADEVILSRADWERLLEAVEDADDIAAVAVAEAEEAAFAAALPDDGARRETRFPLAVIKAELVEGKHPLKAWRSYRGLTQKALAERAEVMRDLIAQIETRKKQGSIETLSRLARALAVPIDALLESV